MFFPDLMTKASALEFGGIYDKLLKPKNVGMLVRFNFINNNLLVFYRMLSKLS